MPTVYSAAIDLGATSGRVILGAWSKNRLTLREVHRFPNAFRSLGAHDYWDIGTLWHEVQAGLVAVLHMRVAPLKVLFGDREACLTHGCPESFQAVHRDRAV